MLPIASWVASTALGLLVFAIFLRRRRDKDAEDLRFAVASPFLSPIASPLKAGDPGSGAPDDSPTDAEATIPRWRRPSVQAARQSRSATATVSMPLRFSAPARPDEDRRVIGYRLVRVGDAPDEVRSAELGRFDRGDEVEVLETVNGWSRVHGASGLEGWLLSETVASMAPAWSADDQPGR